MPERLASARQRGEAQGEGPRLVDQRQCALAAANLQQATGFAVHAGLARLLVAGLRHRFATGIEGAHLLIHARHGGRRHVLRGVHGTRLRGHQQARHPVDGKRQTDQQQEVEPEEGLHAGESTAARSAVNNGRCIWTSRRPHAHGSGSAGSLARPALDFSWSLLPSREAADVQKQSLKSAYDTQEIHSVFLAK